MDYMDYFEQSNKVQKSQGSKGLTKLDWFGLGSGIIGLVADVISLSALFNISQPNATEQAAPIMSFSKWVILFAAIVYTIVIVSFYTRRILINRLRRKSNFLPSSKIDKIDGGVLSLGSLVGAPLLLSHLIVLFHIVRSKIYETDANHLKQFFGMDDATRVTFNLGMRWFIMSILFTALICLVSFFVAKSIHDAIDDES